VAYGIVNADVIGTSVVGSNLGAGNASIMKNRIINGAMVIDQRNAGASVTATTANLYTVDRWQAISTVSSKYSFQQNAGSVTPPVGFSNYLGCTSLSAYSIGSTDQFMIQQGIEGYNIADLAWGTASAKTVTLSFQVYSSLTGTFGGAVRNGTSAYAYPFTYTISSANTWTTVSITIAGPTSGTWNTTNSGGIYLTFSLGVGSTYSATAGSWTATSNIFSATGATSVVGTSGATFYITGVQLEVGSSATGYEYRQIGTELSLCQRYFTQFGTMGWTTGAAYSANRVLFGVALPFAMRATPTVTGSATGVTWFYNSAAYNSTAVSYTGQSSNGTIQVDCTVTATANTAGVANINAGLQVSAEL
jgi:hypothetical protein